MRLSTAIRATLIAASLALPGCTPSAGSQEPRPARPSSARPGAERRATPLDGARDLVLVSTPGWDSTSGTLRRYARDGDASPWRAVGEPVPIVVGQTGLAWDDTQITPRAGEPVKREGDGRSPAGAFPLDTAFGFAPRTSVPWVRLPYVSLLPTTECVDDVRSAHYNTIVDRGRVPRVDWTSSEKMRRIEQYRLGVHVAYNSPPRPSRGSCIFLHVWDGPGSVTAGCTAMDAVKLEAIMRWLDPARRPMLVQLPASEIKRLARSWGLP